MGLLLAKGVGGVAKMPAFCQGLAAYSRAPLGFSSSAFREKLFCPLDHT